MKKNYGKTRRPTILNYIMGRKARMYVIKAVKSGRRRWIVHPPSLEGIKCTPNRKLFSKPEAIGRKGSTKGKPTNSWNPLTEGQSGGWKPMRSTAEEVKAGVTLWYQKEWKMPFIFFYDLNIILKSFYGPRYSKLF
jgi:hypothetical protein